MELRNLSHYFDIITIDRQTYFKSSFIPRSVNIYMKQSSLIPQYCISLPFLKTALSNHYLRKVPSYQPP